MASAWKELEAAFISATDREWAAAEIQIRLRRQPVVQRGVHLRRSLCTPRQVQCPPACCAS